YVTLTNSGGIIFNQSSVNIDSSTFDNNSGGLYALSISGDSISNNLTISNSSFNHNLGTLIANGGNLSIINSTFADNVGRGIDYGGNGQVTINNTIVSNSSGDTNCNGVQSALTSTSTNNLEWNGTTGNISCFNTPINSAPLLSALADNGGP